MDGEDSVGSDFAPKRQSRFHNLRFVVLASAGLSMGILQFLRNTMTVAMVSMVNHTQLFINSHPNMTQDELEQLLEHTNYEVGEFDWNNEMQEKIINSYMITYMIFQFPVAKLIAFYGLRWGISTTIALCAFFNALTPVFAHLGWYWVLILRLAHGAVASGHAPSMVSLNERWTPRDRAAKSYVLYQFISITLTVAAPVLAGLLASVHWKWVYYVPGVVTAAFCIFWLVVVADGPEKSKLISQKELDIISGKSAESSSSQHASSERSIKLEIPFYYILRLKEFYSLLFLWCIYWATSSTFYVLLPAYVHRVYQVPVEQVGGLTTFAQLGSLLSMLWPHQVADIFINKFGLSLTGSRKIVVAICVLMSNVTLAWLAYYHSNIIVVANINRVFHMALDTLFTSTIMSQFGQYGLSGLVVSMVNSLSCLAGTSFCVLVGKFLDYTGDTLECWSWVFVAGIIMNSMYLLVHTLFLHSRPIEMKYLKPKCVDDAIKK